MPASGVGLWIDAVRCPQTATAALDASGSKYVSRPSPKDAALATALINRFTASTADEGRRSVPQPRRRVFRNTDTQARTAAASRGASANQWFPTIRVSLRYFL